MAKAVETLLSFFGQLENSKRCSWDFLEVCHQDFLYSEVLKLLGYFNASLKSILSQRMTPDAACLLLLLILPVFFYYENTVNTVQCYSQSYHESTDNQSDIAVAVNFVNTSLPKLGIFLA